MTDIFISYSHKDEAWKNEVQAHLQVLRHQGDISIWDDRQIKGGDDWYPAIKNAIELAKVAILLVSRDFLNSDFVIREEIPELLARRKSDGLRVLPLIIRPCAWQSVPWLASLQGVTKDNEALARYKLDSYELEAELAKITVEIGRMLQPFAMPEKVTIHSPPLVHDKALILKPVWAASTGQDQFGAYADLLVKGITQRFRWLEPGTFWMGSPASELKRGDNEVRHLVTLSQGFWLADTACTQALWLQVMRNNPAHFNNNAQNPVEQVSWLDVQEFIAAFNHLSPALNARLPSEAQWEYACRAGTNTPFFFGETISPEQVNYDGNYPYAQGRKGLYRKQTVPVKSLAANAWGLYEMHGNIWEWCQDAWQAVLPAEPVTNPENPGDKRSDRVLRGGYWSCDGRSARSARRSNFRPDNRSSIIGFRLALGQS